MERFYYSEFAARETRRIVVEHKIHPRLRMLSMCLFVTRQNSAKRLP